MKKIIGVVFFFIAIGLSFGSFSTADECVKINLHYNERPPYQVPSGGNVTGLTADPVTKAFEKAGVPFQWVSTPSKRQIKLIQQDRECDCGVGWFKNPDREKFALFTIPLYKDNPQVAIVRNDDERIKDGSTLGEAFANKALRLLVKDGYSYGAEIDKKIADGAPPTIKTTVENTIMINMLKQNRGDYYIIAPEEAESLVKASGFKMSDFRFVTFSDMPPGNERYLMCSKKVGESMIKKISAALSEIVHMQK